MISFKLGPRGIICDSTGYISAPSDPEEIDDIDLFWALRFPEHRPEQIYQILRTGMPPYNAAETIEFTVITVDSFFIEASFGSNKNVKFSFNFSGGHCHFNRAEISGKKQGVGSQVMTNMDWMFDIIGTTHVSVQSEKMGSYAWLKFGFLPYGREIESFREAVLKNLETQRYQIGVAERDYIETLLEPTKPDPKVAWAIADIATPAREDVSIKQGQAVLTGIEWGGDLDRRDQEAMAKYRSYCHNKFQDMQKG